MIDNKIKEVVSIFAEKAKDIYGSKLDGVILYGSCARGENTVNSDIDIMLLLSVAPEEICNARNRMLDISDELDLKYDVVIAPVFQSLETYNKYMPVSAFYQNIQREGVRIA